MTWRIIKPRKLEKFPRATSRKVQWRPGLVRRVLVKRIVWISVRHDGELKVRSSLYIAKPCRYQEICLSSNLVSTYYWQLSIVFYLFCPIWPTLGARDFSSAVSGFCQVFIVTRAKSFSRGFGLRPKTCRPSADTETSRRTREKPLVPRVGGGPYHRKRVIRLGESINLPVRMRAVYRSSWANCWFLM